MKSKYFSKGRIIYIATTTFGSIPIKALYTQ
jgi:hypothetical protein